MLTVLDLFSGIGGFSLGLERTGGFKTVAFCEIDNFCQRVLKKHWPEVYIHSDIRTLSRRSWEHFDYPMPEVLCGGFPCQDISNAGRRVGIDGDRSGLWSEYARLIRELRPKYVIVENVSALVRLGLGRVLGELAESGYDAEWDCLPASAFGAPHRRDRIWIVAYPMRSGGSPESREQQGERPEIAHPSCAGDVAHANIQGLEGRECGVLQECAGEQPAWSGGASVADAYCKPKIWTTEPRSERHPWEFEPDVGRVANGVPARVDRIRALGNSIVPQIATWIGERILAAERGE